MSSILSLFFCLSKIYKRLVKLYFFYSLKDINFMTHVLLFMKDQIEIIARDFFTKLWADYSELSVSQEDSSIFRIKIKSEDSHLLIGPHGKNLDTLNFLLRLLISKKSEDKITTHLEINDYLEQKDAKLINFIQTKLNYVAESGKEIILPFFTAYERKKVHSYVSENWGDVYTQSMWEWKERRIHLCKKDTKMTIDIDGDDI